MRWDNSEGRLKKIETNKNKNHFPSPNQFLDLLHCVVTGTDLSHKRGRNRASACVNSAASEHQEKDKNTTEQPVEK